MLVQKMIKRVHGIKVNIELPNTDVYLLAQNAENCYRRKTCVLAVFLYFYLVYVLLTCVRQNSSMDCHLGLDGNFSEVQGKIFCEKVMKRLLRAL